MSKAKAILWHFTDAELLKRGERRGLDTPVVHALNDENSLLDHLWLQFTPISEFSGLANALNFPPEEYGRKVKTQRNRRGLIQVVEHVV